MPKPDGTPLTDAAAAFDAELAVYARLGELFLKTPLTTLKHLERANQTLGDIADCEQRLQDAGKRLIEALSSSRQRQEALSNEVVAYAPTLQARNARLKELMLAMGELASDVAKLNALVMSTNGEPGHPPAADPGEVSTAVLALSERAEQLANASREADFEELASQAHALHQRLKVIGAKLQKAAGN
jgi:DNA repair exonuclease SbcCD ATPase subunit